MNTTYDNSDLQLMCRDIRQRIEYLNEWEIGFFSSIEDLINKGYQLSENRLRTLDKIYEKATENG